MNTIPHPQRRIGVSTEALDWEAPDYARHAMDWSWGQPCEQDTKHHTTTESTNVDFRQESFEQVGTEAPTQAKVKTGNKE